MFVTRAQEKSRIKITGAISSRFALIVGVSFYALSMTVQAETFSGTFVNALVDADNTFNGAGLSAFTANTVSAGTQTFNGSSRLNALGANAVSGGIQNFHDNATLDVQAARSISGGIQNFFDTASLNIGVAGLSDANIIVNLFGAATDITVNNSTFTLGRLTGNGIVQNRNSFATNGFLILDTSILGDSTFDGILRDGGPGKLNLGKTGSGTWTYTGNGSGMSGNTTIDGGTLAINGDIRNSPVFVNSGGTLSGFGTVGTTLVRAGGTIEPSNVLGNLHINGTLTFAAGSVYNVDSEPSGNADRISVSGVGGTTSIDSGSVVRVLAGAGTYVAHTNYIILDAIGGIAGTFGAVSSNLAFLTPSLSYINAGGVDQVILSLARNDISFTEIAFSRNQKSVAAGLSSLGEGGTLASAIEGLDAPAARDAYDQLSGEIHASVSGALVEDSDFIRRSIISRLYKRETGDFWTSGVTSYAVTGAEGNTDRFARHMTGVMFGADRLIDHEWTVGFAGGYGSNRMNARNSTADVDSVYAGMYGGRDLGAVRLRLGGAYSHHQIGTTRTIAFGGYNGSERANYSADSAQVFADVGYRMAIHEATIEPYLAIAQVYVDRQQFNERGNTAALNAAAARTNATFMTAGIRAERAFKTDSGKQITLHSAVGVQHAKGDLTPDADVAFSGGARFTVEGSPIARNSAVYEAGLVLTLSSAVDAGFTYRGRSGGGNESDSANVYVNWRF
jgi:fibronectin-binding autotransporter adhesin